MKLQQLRYALALQEHRHYGRAADACSVSQPTLSMMMKKLEDELGVVLFDRHKSPLEPTADGERLLLQAHKVMKEVDRFMEISKGAANQFAGDFHLGVIPTISPYLVPLFVDEFLISHPKLRLSVTENTTDNLVHQLENNYLDAAILSTPLKNRSLIEVPLFYEEFYVYASDMRPDSYVITEEIDPDRLWLLEEGHCFRTQVMKMCELKKMSNAQLTYRTGNIESLISLVDTHGGLTIVPELSTTHMAVKRKRQLASFAPPAPAREVSLVVSKSFYKDELLDQLKSFILKSIPDYMKIADEYQVVEVPL